MSNRSRNFSSIPVIDFSLSKNPDRREHFVTQLRDALINVGFLYLTNPTAIVEEHVVDEVKDFLPKFFGLPQEEKNKIQMENSPHFMGYNRLGSELTKGKTDLREQFDFATPHLSRWKPGDPEYYNIWGPSQYPSEHILPGFRKTLEMYLDQVWTLVKELIQLTAEALGLPRNAFSRFFDTDDNMQCFGKLVRYPTVDTSDKASQGVGAHFDQGFLTILLQASEHPGLQVQNLAGQWIDVPPIPESFVVNFGRGLEFVTEGIVRATSHRVISPPDSFKTPRYSVPFFQSIDMHARLSDPYYKLEFPEEILRLRDARGKLVDTDAVNFTEFATEPSGKVVLIGRVKSHPNVAEKYYPQLFERYFPQGIPEHFQKRLEVQSVRYQSTPSATMQKTPFFPLIFLLANLSYVLGDLRSDLKNAGITAYLPGDANFKNVSKAYNTRFTFQPAAVSYPKSANDVSQIVKIATANKLPVTTRSGGHSYIANGLGGKAGALVIDMENMKNISVDSVSHVATIETGNRLGNVAKGLNAVGRALPHGTCPYVGIGGHASYGGFGFTSRQWGLTLDNIQAVNMVLANGSIVRATQNANADLFWAARGAAPSFGVVLSFEVTTYDLPKSSLIFSYDWPSLPASNASFALHEFQTYPQRTSLPAELGLSIALGEGGKRNTVDFTIQGGYYGSDGKTGIQKWMDPFLKSMKLSGASLTVQGNGSYIDSVRILAEPDGKLDMKAGDVTDRFYARSIMVPEGQPLTQKACDDFMAYLGDKGFSPPNLDYWFVEADLWGGQNSKINAAPVDSSAFARRDTVMAMQIYASSTSGSSFPANGFTLIDDSTQKLISAMPNNWNYGAYANYIEDRSLDNWQQRYFGTHYARLESIKKAVDSKNLFSFPFSVEVV
ncbi:hypothetical protein V5O48_017299 [Marasmius crinis-equi]|uniref:FAD-binding PCMH-type domain-containing protein n=1 Tax=Marasmius crinis-equi TaxID=585013 RepID=A0ABR3EPD3_9AGAR